MTICSTTSGIRFCIGVNGFLASTFTLGESVESPVTAKGRGGGGGGGGGGGADVVFFGPLLDFFVFSFDVFSIFSWSRLDTLLPLVSSQLK